MKKLGLGFRIPGLRLRVQGLRFGVWGSRVQGLEYLRMLGYEMSWAAFHILEVSLNPKPEPLIPDA